MLNMRTSGPVVGSLLLMLAQPVAAADPAPPAGAISAAEREAIKGIIHQYLLENPEVILESVQAYQERQHELSQKEKSALIASLKKDLEQDPKIPFAGNPKGDVTIVEFYDYRCGYCKRVFPTIRDLVASDGGIRYVYRDFPILGADSTLAARASMAAWLIAPDRHFAFHSAMMSTNQPANQDLIQASAKKAGIDGARLQQAMDDPRVDAALDRTKALAQQLAINGTPAFIIGDKLVPGALDADDLRKAIAEQRRG